MEHSKEQINFLRVIISQKKVPYKQIYIVRPQILTNSYILLDLAIDMFTKSQSRINRLLERKGFVLTMKNSLREKCPNTEFFLVRTFLYLDSVQIQENMDQKKLRIWTLFTQ